MLDFEYNIKVIDFGDAKKSINPLKTNSNRDEDYNSSESEED